jgi:hypothetical protein
MIFGRRWKHTRRSGPFEPEMPRAKSMVKIVLFTIPEQCRRNTPPSLARQFQLFILE